MFVSIEPLCCVCCCVALCCVYVCYMHTHIPMNDNSPPTSGGQLSPRLPLLAAATAMVDATRKLLDELMGRNRNKENVKEQQYWDDDVCKPYLLGVLVAVHLSLTPAHVPIPGIWCVEPQMVGVVA